MVSRTNSRYTQHTTRKRRDSSINYIYYSDTSTCIQEVYKDMKLDMKKVVMCQRVNAMVIVDATCCGCVHCKNVDRRKGAVECSFVENTKDEKKPTCFGCYHDYSRCTDALIDCTFSGRCRASRSDY